MLSSLNSMCMVLAVLDFSTWYSMCSLLVIETYLCSLIHTYISQLINNFVIELSINMEWTSGNRSDNNIEVPLINFTWHPVCSFGLSVLGVQTVTQMSSDGRRWRQSSPPVGPSLVLPFNWGGWCWQPVTWLVDRKANHWAGPMDQHAWAWLSREAMQLWCMAHIKITVQFAVPR